MLSGARRAKHRGGKTEMENTGSRFRAEQNRGAHSTKKNHGAYYQRQAGASGFVPPCTCSGNTTATALT